MAITDAQRIQLGARIRQQRERAFNTKAAAYTKAGVNSATWDKAELGQVVRDDRLRQIVRTLWPETEGDWESIDQPTQAAAMHEGPTWLGDSEGPWVDGLVSLKDFIDETIAGVDGRFIKLEDRVRELERQIAYLKHPDDEEQEGGGLGDSGSTPAIQEPGPRPAKQLGRRDFGLGTRNTGRAPSNAGEEQAPPPDAEGPEFGA